MRGEGGGVAGVGDGRRGAAASTSTTVALARGVAASTSTTVALARGVTELALACGTAAVVAPSISTTAGVGDGRRGATTSTAATDVPPNSKTDVGDRPAASTPAAEPYPCMGQIIQPCLEHQNAGGGPAIGGEKNSEWRPVGKRSMERKEDSHEMAQQSRGSSSGGKNPSSIDDRAGHEEPVKFGTTNSPAAPVTKKKKQTAAEKEMADEAKSFALHCKVWASKHGKRCGSFFETTVLSSMQFTHYTPGLTSFSSTFCCTPPTLQILSIKLTRLDGGLEFPLSVYGVVAVRDLVDRNRNILFTRDILHRQELKQDDPFLHLIGPSRAILFEERVCFEIELRVVAAGSQNKALISCARSYSGGYGDGVYNICFKNRFCTIEVSSQPVKQTVQATIMSVQVLHHNESAWPLEYGGLLVACSPLSGEVVITDDGRLGRNIDPSSSPPIVLVDSKHEAVPKGRDGFVHLWRQVVSVELQGRLDFDIKTYSSKSSGAIAAEASASFLPQRSNISQKKCLLGDAEVTITVAWSRVATSKMGIATESCAKRCF